MARETGSKDVHVGTLAYIAVTLVPTPGSLQLPAGGYCPCICPAPAPPATSAVCAWWSGGGSAHKRRKSPISHSEQILDVRATGERTGREAHGEEDGLGHHDDDRIPHHQVPHHVQQVRPDDGGLLPRRRECGLEVDLLVAVGAGVLLAHDDPAADAELVVAVPAVQRDLRRHKRPTAPVR